MSGAERPLFLQGFIDDSYCPAPTSSATSILSSRTNSTGGRSRQESIFSNKSLASNSSASSAPSTHTAASSFDLWHAGHIPPTPEAFDEESDTIDPYMSCEFLYIHGCSRTFHHDELQLCIDHIQNEHFRGQRPNMLSCWWCNVVFDAQEMDFQSELVLVRRMEHIQDHIIHGEYSLIRNPQRQDLHLLNFLWCHELIQEDVFREQYFQSELPLPDGMQACDAGQKPIKPSSHTMVVHDNNKEERLRKRERRKEKESRTKR